MYMLWEPSCKYSVERVLNAWFISLSVTVILLFTGACADCVLDLRCVGVTVHAGIVMIYVRKMSSVADIGLVTPS